MLSRLYRPAVTVAMSQARNASVATANIGDKSQYYFDREKKFGAHNYAPMGVAINKGQGKYTLSFTVPYSFVQQDIFPK